MAGGAPGGRRGDHRDQRHPAGRHHARAPHHLHGDDEDRAQPDACRSTCPRRRPGRATCRSSSASCSRPTGAPLVDGKPVAERRRDPPAGARRADEAPRAARGHQGRRRGDARPRHPRARPAQAGARHKIAFGVTPVRRAAALTPAPRRARCRTHEADRRRRTAQPRAPIGAARRGRSAPRRLSYDDPMSKVLGLDAQTSGLGRVARVLPRARSLLLVG